MLGSQPDFSLVLGGPLFQIYRRTHLSGDALELLQRRMLVFSTVTWLPLLLLSALHGDAFGKSVPITFVEDIEAHVRFLIALPILIAAELVVHRRIRFVVVQFLEHGIVAPEDVPRFRDAIDSTMRLRNSPVIELALLAVVYTVGLWIWRTEVALGMSSWYASAEGTQMRLTAAGYWNLLVSVPIFQFVLLRWYFRFFLWFWFLLRVSRLQLRLLATHADRAAGLGFLDISINAFALVLLAQGSMLAGLIASQILHAGRDLMSFKVQIVGFLALFVGAALVPLIVFTPHLVRAKRNTAREFAGLVSRYTREFQRKWVEGGAPVDEPLLGSSDIQSLADIGNSFTVVRETRLVPFSLKEVSRLAAVSAVPFVPLLFTTFSVNDLATYLLKAIFGAAR